MVDPHTVQRWLHRAAFVAISALALFIYILPLHVGMGRWPGPDPILAFALAWVLRRPNWIPLWLAAPVFLLCDFMFLRPPGLWAALCVIALEFLRTREATSRDMPFAVEWAMVGGVMLAMAVVYRAVLAVFMVDLTSLGLVISGQISTLIAYPFVVLMSASLLGVRRLTPAEADELRGQA
ncbi:rod shape-determining protein MreD [Celeribacter sp.]|uniref:rod shape-determining protein MreD n=1 Tax=Celeribacter sp. TaxID=1890673 RepID=UPI003A956D31